MIEKAVVAQIDEELRRCTVDDRGPGHRERPAQVLFAVRCFILDGIASRLLVHVRGHATALDHETRDDPVKNRVIEKTILGVLAKIGAGKRRALFEQFDDDVAMIRGNGDHNGPRQA